LSPALAPHTSSRVRVRTFVATPRVAESSSLVGTFAERRALVGR